MPRQLPGRRLILAVTFFLAAAVSGTPLWAQYTYVCNETREPLYITVRHNAPSIFTANSRTEGWHRLPVRGLIRSCKIFNRASRDHYIVAGVRRGEEIVPVRFRLRDYDIRREVYVCVPIAATSFEYRSPDRSDSSCAEGYNRARISGGVLGGDNEVSIDLGGDTSGIKAPERARAAAVPDEPKDPRSKHEIEFDAKRGQLIGAFSLFKEKYPFSRSDTGFGGFFKVAQVSVAESFLEGAVIATLRTVQGKSEIVRYALKPGGEAVELRAVETMEDAKKNLKAEVANHPVRVLSWRITMADSRFASLCLFHETRTEPLSCRALRWYEDGSLVVEPKSGSVDGYELRIDAPSYYYLDASGVVRALSRSDERLVADSPIVGRL